MEINEKLLPKYKKGEIVEIGGANWPKQAVFSSYVTNGTKAMLFNITLPKKLTNITSISVNSMQIELRGINGYVNSTSGYIEYVGKSDYTITALIQNENTVKFYLEKSSNFTNITNNTPVTIDGYIKLQLN